MNEKIYIYDTSLLMDDDNFRFNYDKMPVWRRDKIDRLKNMSDKRQSLGAGIVLALALKDVGLNLASENVSVSEYGAPYLKDHPDIYFSLSHSGERAMCIISDSPVGCDVELPKDFNEKLVKRFFSAEEQKKVFEAKDKQRMMYRIWTLKECFIKACGRGLYMPLEGFTVSEVDGDTVAYDGDEKFICHYYDNGDEYIYSFITKSR